MSNIKPFVSKEDIHQQACEWISKIDRGLSADEKLQLSVWASSSDAHKTMLFKLAELWDDLSALHELSGLFPLREKEPVPRKVFRDSTRWSIAAAFAFLMIGSVAWLLNSQNHVNQDANVASRFEAETSLGEQKPVTLPDGSVIHMNTNSLVYIDYSNKQRAITLARGEAHFDVAHDETRPFVVKTGKNSVTAVGTAFNIQLGTDGEFELLVTEGKVLVQDVLREANSPTLDMVRPLDREGVLMVSGEKATFSGLDNQPETLSLDQVQRDLAWQQGMLVFQGEPLADALVEVSRYTPIHFEISEEKIKQKRVAGYFKAGDIDGLLFALKNNFGIDHQLAENDRVILSSL